VNHLQEKSEELPPPAIPEPEFVLIPPPKLPITTEGTLNQDAAATYIAWLTQNEGVNARMLMDWRNRGVGPNDFAPEGTRLMTYQKESIDAWFWGSRNEPAVDLKAA
jgi:hypothetical protein